MEYYKSRLTNAQELTKSLMSLVKNVGNGATYQAIIHVSLFEINRMFHHYFCFLMLYY